jgi:FPC/CPF motif-containing protein YcgG
MIDEELAREAIGLLGAAAAMLVEDAHLELLTNPTDIDTARDIAATLQRIGTDVDALGAAAAVLAQRSK